MQDRKKTAAPEFDSIRGKVVERFSGSRFRVKLEDGREIDVHTAVKFMNQFRTVMTGDVVTVEISPHDPLRGRIVDRD